MDYYFEDLKNEVTVYSHENKETKLLNTPVFEGCWKFSFLCSCFTGQMCHNNALRLPLPINNAVHRNLYMFYWRVLLHTRVHAHTRIYKCTTEKGHRRE